MSQPHHEHEGNEDDHELAEEDIVEVHELDDDDEPMDDDDDNAQYDGEIIIGGPGPGEEEEMMEAEEQRPEDNSWGSTCTSNPSLRWTAADKVSITPVRSIHLRSVFTPTLP